LKEEIYQEALQASTIYPDLVVTPVASGLINQTYKVIIKTNGYRFILQQINHNVFPEPEKVQDNYYKIWDYLFHNDKAKKIANPVKVPKPLKFMDEKYLFRDSQKNYWRKFECVDGAATFQNASTITQAKKVALTFGSITRSFESPDLNDFHVMLPGFHDLSLRFRQFKQSLHSKNLERLLKTSHLIEHLKKREHYVSFYEVITESDEFQKRIMHHDAKISNILFDEETGKVICPIDFDTCMPGYFFSDLGDMIRSMACSEAESNNNYSDLHIRKDYYEAILESYLEVMDDLLTEAEKKYIHVSGLLIIYMQALRFITDYLNEDKYYKTTYAEENFDRVMNQWVLLEKMEEFLHNEYLFRV
jgi:Ser/Thr protein kinase RdoA (MazF antagonist)